MAKVTERQIEAKLVDWVTKEGGHALKGSTHFDTGFPDRMLFLPKANAYVEVKGTSNTYHLSAKQKLWAGRIIASNIPYYVIESLEGLERFKQSVYSFAQNYTRNLYSLNGDNLWLSIHETTQTLEVFSIKEGKQTRILSGMLPSETVDKIIYRIFIKLEQLYPTTNYEDI